MFICKIDACDHRLGITLITRKCYWIETCFFPFYLVLYFIKRGGVFEIGFIVQDNVHRVLLKATTDLVKQMIQSLSS